jgi:hypothetical protein
VTESDEHPKLNVDLVKQILEAYGEIELAQNHELMQEMVDACSTGNNNGSSQVLDKFALAAGLTMDIDLWDLANEGSLSTNLADVLGGKDESENGETAQRLDQALDDSSTLFHFSAGTRQKRMYSHIDVTAGNFRSKSLIMLLWATFAISYFTFSWGTVTKGLDEVCWGKDASYEYSIESRWSARAIACDSVIAILVWLFYFIGLARTWLRGSRKPN